VFRAVLMLCLAGCSSVLAQNDICQVDNLVAGGLATLTSPNYPGSYYSNVDCSVTITAPSGKLIHVTIDAFNLESGTNCGYDYFEMGDSGRLCGTGAQGMDYVSSGNVLTVLFHTDYSVVRSGFSLSYEVLADPAGDASNAAADVCDGGELVAGVGFVQSPNHPENYGSNLDCSITIRAPEGKLVHVVVNDTFEMEQCGSSCSCDSLRIGESGKLCGTAGAGFDYMSSGNVLTITFRTDYSITRPGFTLFYEAVDSDLCDMGCFVEHTAKHISWGTAAGLMSRCDCKDLCINDDNCIGFDFNNDDPPYQDSSCWIHTVDGDLIDPSMDVNHYANIC